MKKKRIEKNH